MPGQIDETTDHDAMAQIARLRAQVEALMRDRVVPTVADAAEQASSAAHDAANAARHHAETLSAKVREQPLTALLIAFAAGVLLGRASH